MKPPLSRLIAAFAFAALLTWLTAWRPFSPETVSVPCRFELNATIPSASGAIVTLRIDEGHGLAEDRPADLMGTAQKSAGPQMVPIMMPPGRIRSLQMNVFGCPKLLVTGARLRTKEGKILAEFSPETFQPAANARQTLEGTTLQMEPAPGNAWFGSTIVPATPVIVPSGNEPSGAEVLGDLVAFAGVFLLVPMLLGKRMAGCRFERLRRWCDGLSRAVYSSPAFSLGAVALLAAIASSYPVVFCDKSFVSPSNFALLLYPTMPTLPGIPKEPMEDFKGSDVAATMWAHLPYSVQESRAIWHDHELPLWNRYGSAGVPLLGQGQAMLGDPLHWITLIAGGAWWAWDLKFLLAKTFFCFGLGLCAWLLMRRFAVAALIGASGAWLGFFAFRFNHPAFFSVCYAPWVLLPWLRLAAPATWRRQLAWGALLIVADMAELNSGTAKESSMLLLSLNSAGFLSLLLSPGALRARLGRIVPLVWASFLFFLLSAPFWLVFFDALHQAMSSYDVPHAHQLKPGMLLGFFDEIFSQDAAKLENHFHPSVNFLVLSGLLWLIAAWPRWRSRGNVTALVLAASAAGALVFGVVPPEWITATPFIGNIQHIHNTFGCVLVVLLPLLAAVGLNDCLTLEHSARWLFTWRRAMIAGALLAALYFGSAQAMPNVAPASSLAAAGPLHSRFFAAYTPALFLSLFLLPWGLRWLMAGGAHAVSGATILAACLVTMHFRHGMYVATKFDSYVMNPRTGGDLVAESMALDRVQHRLKEPFRAAGFGATLSPGYDALMGLEGITGPDALWNRPYHELCTAAQLDYEWDWRIAVDEASVPRLKRIYDLLNLRFYLRYPSSKPPASLSELSPIGQVDLALYESKEAWPRAFFTDACASYGTVKDFVRLAIEGDGRPFAAVQGTSPLPAPSASRQVEPARDYHLTCNSTAFSVKATGPGIVVLSEAYEEGNFRVTVNGAPVSYERVNHAFKGVRIDRAGDYRILFSYWPRLLTPSLWMAGSGLLLAMLTPLAAWAFHRRRRPIEARLPLLAAASA